MANERQPRMGPAEYARAAAAPGSDMQRRVLAGLRHYEGNDKFAISHIRLDPPNVETPHGTTVIRCRSQAGGEDLCVKFFDDSPGAKRLHRLERLRRHAEMLRQVCGKVPAPRLISVEEDRRRLGLPALVTTWTGEMLIRTAGCLGVSEWMTLAQDIASAAAIVNTLDPDRAGLPPADLESVNREYVLECEEDAGWCEEWLAAEGRSADSCTRELMERGRQVFSARREPLRTMRVIHMDLHEENITTAAGRLSGFVDWDKAAVASPQQEVGKLICCFLSLPIPRTRRAQMLRLFLDRYLDLAEIDPEEVSDGALVFALSRALYLLIFRRTREAAWASEVILNGLDAGARAATSWILNRGRIPGDYCDHYKLPSAAIPRKPVCTGPVLPQVTERTAMSTSTMNLDVIPLQEQHLEDAASLFAAGYRVLRGRVASMPARHESVGSVLPKLQALAAKAPGVVAIRDGHVAGFLLGEVLPEFRGKRAVYSPEWTHAAEPAGRFDVYRAMYAKLSGQWAADGCSTHVITMLAHQDDVVDAYSRLEFGMAAVDAMRDVGPVQGDGSQSDIRQAGPSDLETVLDLIDALDQHVAAAPVFLYCVDRERRQDARDARRKDIEQRLADPERPSWLALHGGRAVAYVHAQPGRTCEAYVVRDDKTARIATAFTNKHCRGRGIATALLDRAIDWARSTGRQRCAVDFEPHNIPGSRFWLRHFQPVCYSMIRRLDERVTSADSILRTRKVALADIHAVRKGDDHKTATPLESARDSRPFEITGLTDRHLPEAAELFAAGYRVLRRRVASMPARHESVGSVLPKLQALAAKAPGVVAIRDGHVAGFLLGKVLPEFRGKRAVYSPEWAHAAAPEGRRDIYRAMYAHVARRWVDDGCLAHLITTLADQQEVLDGFFRLGFGMIGVDAMRDVTPIAGSVADVEIRQAGAGDTDAVLRLVHALEDHIAASPVYKCCTNKTTRETVRERLDGSEHAIWLALIDGVPAACVDMQSPKASALYVIADETTANITKAFTDVRCRGRGIATALLSHILTWARSRGFERCAVGFEPQNIPGSRFWLRHFQPVCCSMIRHVDERIAGARERRSV